MGSNSREAIWNSDASHESGIRLCRVPAIEPHRRSSVGHIIGASHLPFQPDRRKVRVGTAWLLQKEDYRFFARHLEINLMVGVPTPWRCVNSKETALEMVGRNRI